MKSNNSIFWFFNYDYIKSVFNLHSRTKMNRMLEIALMEYGTKEWAGTSHNPEVLKYFRDCGFDEINNDETSWCSAAMCWCALQSALPHTGSLMARSWLKWGEPVTMPKLGDVAVFWREDINGPFGHVGLFIRNLGSSIYVLGGNQSNTFNIAPQSANKLLGFRRFE